MHFRVLFLLKQGRTNSAEICTEYCPRGRNYRLSILQESPGHLEDEKFALQFSSRIFRILGKQCGLEEINSQS